MKQRICIILLLLLSVIANGQSRWRNVNLHYQEVDMKRVHYGFTLGVNYMDYNIWFNSMTPIRGEVALIEPGLTVGLVSNIKLNNYFSFRITPGFVLGGRKITFSQPEDAKLDSYSGSILAECPLLLKLSSERYGNNRAYMVGGVNVKYDIISENSINPENMVFTRNK